MIKQPSSYKDYNSIIQPQNSWAEEEEEEEDNHPAWEEEEEEKD